MSEQEQRREPPSVLGMDSQQLDRILSLGLEEAEPAEPAASVSPLDQLMERPGALIDRYRLVEVLGEGGMAVVYMAEQTEPIRRKVALKIIKVGMDTRQVIARFEAERQALALMDHPYIAKVLDAGATESGRPYFVMELVEGVSITAYCNEHRLSISARLVLFAQLCQAVQHAHEQGIIHRDIKPTNILVAQRHGVPSPKVIDFGIAKAVNQRLTEKTLHTCYEQLIGTPVYMSPEQAGLDEGQIDTRTDIYSLGILLYELLVGSTPFDSEALHRAGYLEMQRIIRQTEPPTPSAKLNSLGDARRLIAQQRQTTPESLSREIKGDLDWIVMKAMEKDRSRRYETARALAEDIQRHLDNLPVLAGSPGVRYRLGKFVVRHRQCIVITLAILLALSSVLSALVMIHRAKAQVLSAIADRGTPRQGRRLTGAVTIPQPVAWWRFDETSGSVAHDSIGSNHATIHGPTRTPGYAGGALHFDGIDDFVRTPVHIDQTEGSAGATFCAWVYPELKEPNEYHARWGDRHVISTDNRGQDWSILCKDEDLWRIFVGQGVTYAGLPVDVNQWQFVAAAFEPQSGVRFYKNRQQVFIPRIGYDVSDKVTIGDTPYGTPAFFCGKIDEVRIYDRPLSDREILEVSGLGQDGGIEQVRLPVTWWCYRRQLPQDLVQAHVGTIVGTPQWVAGRFKGALAFDGIDDYLDCGNRRTYNVAGPITVCAWIELRAVDKDIQTIVSKGDSAWRLQSSGAGAGFHCTLQSGATLALDGSTRVDDHAWHHVAGVFDCREGRLYIDGVLEDSESLTGVVATNNQPMWIGNNSERPGQNWNGAIRDVRLYDRVLSPQEIAALGGQP